MYAIVWEFRVREGAENQFIAGYGPDGDWAQFFRRSPHFRETRLLRELSRPNAYMTLDVWDSRSACENFRQQNREVYLTLDRSSEAMTLREKHLGSFDEIP